jgi:hypothetical protein
VTTRIVCAAVILVLQLGCSSSPVDHLWAWDHPTSAEADSEIADSYCRYLADCFGKDFRACYVRITEASGSNQSVFSRSELKACTEAIDVQPCTTVVSAPAECKGKLHQ